MSEETPQERQRSELVVLQSIYGESVTEIESEEGEWGEEPGRRGWRPLHVALALLPLHDSAGAHCSLTLCFKCNHEYPNKPPKISVKSVKGLSLENMKELLKELEQLSTQLCGEVMIYQLADYTQQFLHKHNKPTLSFYDQMVKEKIELEETRLRELQVKQAEEAKRMRAELLKRQETLRETSQPNDEADDALRLLCYEESQSSPWASSQDGAARGICNCTGKGTRILRFSAANTKIYLSNCLAHSRLGSAHLALDESGAPLLVRRWQLPDAPDVRRRERELAALQRDLAAVAGLHCAALEPYRSLHVHTDRRQYLYAARRHLHGTSLSRYATAARRLLGGVDLLQLVRHVARSLFTALAELHAHGLLHRDVRAENIFLEHDGAVKLIGVSVDARVMELINEDGSCERHSRAQDVARAGGVLAALVAPGERALPCSLPPDARDFLARCAAPEEQSLWPAARLAAHPFLQAAVPRAPTPPPPAPEDEDSGQLSELHLPRHNTSRLCAEFEVLSWIGKGGFGDVVKVRNKLDCGIYAIKRIKLNPQDVSLNRKITREVKLLSRLHHENVVRYYNAWIEATTSPVSAGGDGGAENALDRPPVSIEWSLSNVPRPPPAGSDSEEDEDDDPDLDFDPWTLSPEDDSSGIVFRDEMDSEESAGEAHGAVAEPRDVLMHPPTQQSHQQHLLYIQMEFCEKHTLRQAIDRGLHEDPVRTWRLFREVLEGLAHVHSKGMIHRDLKPANIFLDSNDHVKIGDFGLATKIFSKESVEDRTKSQEEGDGTLTGEVGTVLYVAPELRAGGAATRYNQKADVYSLGVTLFEMFHGPFATGAERAAVLARLRRPEVLLPDYFDIPENAKQVYLLRWMLHATPSERPSCAQLVASHHVPRAVPQGTLAALLAHSLADRDAPAYGRLVRACLEQRAQPADEFLFHEHCADAAHLACLARLADAVVTVFRSHCAEEVTPPLLTLRAGAWESRADAVRLMTSSGAVCVLPYDLRLPFARLVVQSGVQRLRRYAVGRVYRERTARGCHPREALQCAFDIVTPRAECTWADAEALVCASRCAQALGLRTARVRLGHALLLRTLLCCAGLPPERAPPLVAALRDFALGRLARLQLQTHVSTLALGARRAAMLMRMVDADVPVHELSDLIAQVQQDKWSEVLQRSARELVEVERRARALGCELPMTVAPLLAYGAEQHCGVFWQLVAGEPARRLRERHVLAAGGRYDELVQQLGRPSGEKGAVSGAVPGAVGFSLSLERAAALCAGSPLLDPPALDTSPAQQRCPLPAFVCVSGAAGAGGAGGAGLAREAWARGLRCALWEGGGEAAGVRGVAPAGVLLQPTANAVRVELWDETRVRELVLPPGDALELVRQRQQTLRAQDGGGRGAAGGTVQGAGHSAGLGAPGGEGERGAPAVLVTFVTGEEKINKNYKKQIENQGFCYVVSERSASQRLAAGHLLLFGKVTASVCARVALAASARRVCVLALAADAHSVARLAARLPAPPHHYHHHQQHPHDPLPDPTDARARLLHEAQAELEALVRVHAAREEPPLLALYSIPDAACRLLL